MQCYGRVVRRYYSRQKTVHKVDVSKIESALHIHKLEDWYSIPKVHLTFADKHALKQYENVEQLAREAYPEHNWDHERFYQQQAKQKATQTPQSFMARVVRTIFGPDVTIDTNVRASLGLLGNAGLPLEIDVYLPQLKLGFEYQDEHHYFHNIYGSTTLEEYQERDRMKFKKAAESGITIIPVPFWWDWNVESLVATIKQHRSDLLSSVQVKEEAIVQSPPSDIKSKYNYEIPDLGVPMLALYSPQTRLFDPTAWWVMEKYDGIRAIWHAGRRTLYSRWAKPLRFPHWFIDSLPNRLWLDGEAWFGNDRGARYQAIKSAVAVSMHIIKWEKMKYIIFDTPQPGLRSTATYEERYNILQSQVPESHPLVALVSYEVCTGRESVEQKFMEIRAREGEGVIIRDPYAFYINGYSRFIYKHKGYNDAEAMVLKKLSDERYLCRVHKQHIKHNVVGKENKTQQEQQEQEEPEQEDKLQSQFYDIEMVLDDQLYEGDLKDIKEGGFISFRYIGTTFGPPVNPKIYAVRSDVQDWVQLVGNKRQPPAHQSIWKPVGPSNDWTQVSHRRAFLDKFAMARGFDPLVADNWYHVDSTSIRSQAAGMLEYYNYSHIAAITQLYPDIGLEPEKFESPPAKHWSSQENRTKFLNSFAKSHNFDPLVAANWYQFTSTDIRKVKGGNRVLQRHGGQLYPALSAAYPFVDFDKFQFDSLADRYTLTSNRASFFTQFAMARGFDPLLPHNWYPITIGDITSTKAGQVVMAHYNHSLFRALSDVFPHVPFQSHHFANLPAQFWTVVGNQRAFFDEFARNHGSFDPTVPSNWQPFQPSDVVNEKHGRLVLANYQGKLGPALSAVYLFQPPITFPQDEVEPPKRKSWRDRAQHRAWLDSQAKRLNIDPLVPDMWYSVSLQDLKEEGVGLLRYYRSLPEAIMSCYPNIGLEPSKFIKTHPRNYWLSMDNRKKQFDEYAKSMKFNPRIAENWYHLSSLDIKKYSWGRSMLQYYHSSVAKALMDVYPNIGLDITKFRTARMFRG